MLGKKNEEFTLLDLGELVKKNIDKLTDVESFEYDSNSISLLQSNKVGTKLWKTVTKVKNKFVFRQEITGRVPESMDSKNLLDWVEMFPIAPETKKTLSKKYK